MIEERHKKPLTAREQKIVLTMVSMIQTSDEDFKDYRISVKSFSEMLGLKGSVKYTQMKEIAEKMLGVIQDSKDKIVFSKEELDDLINRVADEAVERAAEHLSRKIMDVIEQRDKKIVHNLTETMEQKRLEIATAIEEEKPGIFSRFF